MQGAVGLTRFRIELSRSGPPLVITLRASEGALLFDPRNDWMLPAAPARLELAVLDAGRMIAQVEIEDARRTKYPERLRAEAERITRELSPTIAELHSAISVL